MSPAPPSDLLNELRRLPGLIEEQPPRPLAIARLEARFRRATGTSGATCARIARDALRQVAANVGVLPTPAMAAILRAALGEIAGLADARSGDFESCMPFYEEFFDRHDAAPLSLIERAFAGEPWTQASAFWTRARIANHRGDVRGALAALRRVRLECAREDSTRMSLLAAEAAITEAVSVQNRWPFDPASEPDGGAMAEAARSLEALIARLRDDREASELSAAATPLHLGDKGSEPVRLRRDPTLAAALGTLGRTYAFLGRHDDAVQALLEARGRFVSPADRALSAHFLAQVELDRGSDRDGDRLECVLRCLVPPHTRDPAAGLARLRGGDLGFRFTVNLWLKAMAVGMFVAGVDRGAWCEALAERAPDGWGATVAAARSHPSELLCRYAGELLAAVGDTATAAWWFDVGVAIAREGGSTMQRLALFTERLARGEGAVFEDPRGSLHNPCFEHR
jgi:hypothetical protein